MLISLNWTHWLKELHSTQWTTTSFLLLVSRALTVVDQTIVKATKRNRFPNWTLLLLINAARNEQPSFFVCCFHILQTNLVLRENIRQNNHPKNFELIPFHVLVIFEWNMWIALEIGTILNSGNVSIKR